MIIILKNKQITLTIRILLGSVFFAIRAYQQTDRKKIKKKKIFFDLDPIGRGQLVPDLRGRKATLLLT